MQASIRVHTQKFRILLRPRCSRKSIHSMGSANLLESSTRTQSLEFALTSGYRLPVGRNVFRASMRSLSRCLRHSDCRPSSCRSSVCFETIFTCRFESSRRSSATLLLSINPFSPVASQTRRQPPPGNAQNRSPSTIVATIRELDDAAARTFVCPLGSSMTARTASSGTYAGRGLCVSPVRVMQSVKIIAVMIVFISC